MVKKYLLLLSLCSSISLFATSEDEYDAAYFEEIDALVLGQRALVAETQQQMLRQVFAERVASRIPLKKLKKEIWTLCMGNTLDANPLEATIKKQDFQSVKNFFNKVELIATPDTFEKLMLDKKFLTTALDTLLDVYQCHGALEAIEHILSKAKTLNNVADRLEVHLIHKFLDKGLGFILERQEIPIQKIKEARKRKIEQKESEKKRRRIHDPYDHNDQTDPYA